MGARILSNIQVNNVYFIVLGRVKVVYLGADWRMTEAPL